MVVTQGATQSNHATDGGGVLLRIEVPHSLGGSNGASRRKLYAKRKRFAR